LRCPPSSSTFNPFHSNSPPLYDRNQSLSSALTPVTLGLFDPLSLFSRLLPSSGGSRFFFFARGVGCPYNSAPRFLPPSRPVFCSRLTARPRPIPVPSLDRFPFLQPSPAPFGKGAGHRPSLRLAPPRSPFPPLMTLLGCFSSYLLFLKITEIASRASPHV